MNNNHGPQDIAVTMRVLLYKDGSMEVKGFPGDLRLALDMLNKAQGQVVKFFVDKAKTNELDDNYCINRNAVVVPKPQLIKF